MVAVAKYKTWGKTRYWLLLIVGSFGFGYVWISAVFPLQALSFSVITKASIQLDVSLPRSPLFVQQQLVNNKTLQRHSERGRWKYKSTASRFMLQLYQQQPDADIVRAVLPSHISRPVFGGGKLVEFSIPPLKLGEFFETAELLGIVGMILRVWAMEKPESSKVDIKTFRKDHNWQSFNVTNVVQQTTGKYLRFFVLGRVGNLYRDNAPILLLKYSKPKKRSVRSVPDQDDHDERLAWDDDGAHRRKRRNACRRRPLYVDFAMISYDEWIVAPAGYEAYQCAGKCLYPLGDHLSPTKHAIVQTLVHSALQGRDGGKSIGRACCVPTRLAPTSLLYLDASGTLTYQYGYDDMVVLECGCR